MRTILALLTALWLGTGTWAQAEIRTDFVMDSDPKMDIPVRATIFPSDQRRLWLEALSRPEADMQRFAAEAIARGHRAGMPGLEAAVPALVKVVAAPETHSVAKFAAARTLIDLRSRESADVLLEASRSSSELRALVEPALAEWRFLPAVEIWRTRIENRDTRLRELLLAIRGLEAVCDQASAPALLVLVEDRFRAESVRLAAARAAGRVQETGFESHCERLAQRPSASVADRLCAVALLVRHHGEEAERLLIQLAADSEPAVSAPALARLNALNPHAAASLADTATKSADPSVRREGAVAYAKSPSPERIAALGQLLNDPHPAVRRQVCESLLQLAGSPGLEQSVLQTAVQVLAGSDWRGQEQAALLLAALDHKPAASRLVELLESPRGEVMVASAWGLRKLAVPDTLPAILDRARRLSDRRTVIGPPGALDQQAGHLYEALGVMKYAAADSLMRKYIKGRSFGEFARSGAIWALGQLHANEPDQSLVDTIVERMVESLEDQVPEPDRVLYMCAACLARMRAESAVPPLRSMLEKVGRRNAITVAAATRWLIHEMTGEEFPDPLPRVHSLGSFLEPLDGTASGPASPQPAESP